MSLFRSGQFINRAIVTALVAACLATVAFAQQRADDPTAARQLAEALNRQPDNPGRGFFPAMKEEIVSLPAHVIYRPRDLDSLGPVF